MKKFIDFLLKKAATPEEQSELQAIADELNTEPNTPTTPVIPDTTNLKHNSAQMQEILTAFNAMKAQNEKLVQELAKRNEAEKQRETYLAEQAKTEATTRNAAIIAEMKKDGRLPAQNAELEAKFLKMLESDPETAGVIIESLPKNPALTNTTGAQPQTVSTTPAQAFKRSEIAAMTEADYSKNRAAIIEATKTNMIIEG